MKNNILITGAAGKLGKALNLLLPNSLKATRDNFDLLNFNQMMNFLDANKNITTIIHCAAMVSPPKINEDIIQAIQSNIIGTSFLSTECFKRKIKLLYISTDYVFSGSKGFYNELDELFPQNKYAWSKLGGECAVRLLDNYVIIRLSFGPEIFPYKAAYIDQYTTRETVSVVAKKIKKIINSNFNGVIHIGGDRKTVYEYAQSIGAENVEKISINNSLVKIPKDTSLDTNLYNNYFKTN